MKIILILGASLFALSACGTAVDTDADNAAANVTADNSAMIDVAEPDATVVPAPAAYLAMAGAGDMFEIESSKALLATSKDEATRKFAQMMIDNHTASTAKLMGAAKTDAITPPAVAMNPAQAKMIADIKAASAETVDKIYLDHQRTAHGEALTLHQGFATGGTTAALKAAAGEIVPVVEAHITDLVKMP